MSTPDLVYLAWPRDPATSLTVVWKTADATLPSEVEYRLPGEADWTRATGVPRPSGTPGGTLHEATLTGLPPGTALEYRVRMDGGLWSDALSARTAPGDDEPFDLVFFADTGLVGRLDGRDAGTQRAIDSSDALDPLFVLGGGDYAYFDTDKRFGTLDATIDEWFRQWEPVISGAPFMTTWGNHEVYLDENVEAWAARVPVPEGYAPRHSYGFDVEDVHFVSILAAEGNAALPQAQLDWIRADIEAAWDNGAEWVIPYMHVPPYSDGTSHPSNLRLRAQLAPVFDELGVKIVLTTHDQSYERTLPLEGIPDRVVPTTTDADGPYWSETDGIVWLKVSPAGKLSNKGGVTDFSRFRTEPPPAHTAARDDDHHHFARLSVDAEDNITVEVWAYADNASQPFVLDSFTYRLGAGPSSTNAPPVVAAPIEDQRALTGLPFAFTLPAGTFDDPNLGSGDSLTLSASGLPPGLTFDPAGGAFGGTTQASGLFEVEVAASDRDGATASDGFVLSVALPGTSGADTLAGGGAADLLDGLEGSDLILGQGGDDRLWGAAGADTVEGAAGEDLLDGGGGDDLLKGAGGEDRLAGGDGRDTLDGGTGADAMRGGADDDTYIVNHASDAVVELPGSGIDTVRASVSHVLGAEVETLALTGSAGLGGTGGAADDAVFGNSEANLLSGMGGDDALEGRGGDDTLEGGAGGDTLVGGTGLDAFRFAQGTEGRDLIRGYKGVEDRVEVSAAGFGGGLAPGMDIVAAGRYLENGTGQTDAPAGVGQFVYETDARLLWWDADGAGGGPAVALVRLAGASGWAGTEIAVVA